MYLKSGIKRQRLLLPSSKQKDPPYVPLITTYTPQLGNLNNILQKHFNILQVSKKLRQIFPKPPRTVYRRPSNIKDILVSAKINGSQLTVGCFPCNEPRCRTCSYVTQTSCVTSFTNQYYHKIRSHITCKTSNIIYLISCKRCNLQYIGESTNSLRIR